MVLSQALSPPMTQACDPKALGVSTWLHQLFQAPCRPSYPTTLHPIPSLLSATPHSLFFNFFLKEMLGVGVY